MFLMPKSCMPHAVSEDIQTEAGRAMFTAAILRKKMALLWRPGLTLEMSWPRGIGMDARVQIMIELSGMGYNVHYGKRCNKILGGEYIEDVPEGWDASKQFDPSADTPLDGSKCNVTYIRVPGESTVESEQKRIKLLTDKISDIFGGSCVTMAADHRIGK